MVPAVAQLCLLGDTFALWPACIGFILLFTPTGSLPSRRWRWWAGIAAVAPMSVLLGRLVAAQRSDPTAAGGVPLGDLGRLLRALEHEATAAASPSKRGGMGIPGLVKALSEPELEVLRLLAAGKPNREIAGELYVAVDTVKKHVTHIFEKLGAANRTQATARARELGLLADAAEPPTTTRP